MGEVEKQVTQEINIMCLHKQRRYHLDILLTLFLGPNIKVKARMAFILLQELTIGSGEGGLEQVALQTMFTYYVTIKSCQCFKALCHK